MWSRNELPSLAEVSLYYQNTKIHSCIDWLSGAQSFSNQIYVFFSRSGYRGMYCITFSRQTVNFFLQSLNRVVSVMRMQCYKLSRPNCRSYSNSDCWHLVKWYICSDVSETHGNKSVTLNCVAHNNVTSRCSVSGEVKKVLLNIIEIEFHVCWTVHHCDNWRIETK